MRGGGNIWEEWVNEGNQEDEYGWCTFYTRMNIEFLKWLKPPEDRD
jgi:hypothetical protein